MWKRRAGNGGVKNRLIVSNFHSEAKRKQNHVLSQTNNVNFTNTYCHFLFLLLPDIQANLQLLRLAPSGLTFLQTDFLADVIAKMDLELIPVVLPWFVLVEGDTGCSHTTRPGFTTAPKSAGHGSVSIIHP